MNKTTQTEPTLTEIFAEHCKIILEDIAAASANGKKKLAKRIMAVGKAVIELYAEIYEIALEQADDYLYIVACGGNGKSAKKTKETRFDPQKLSSGVFGKFSNCINNTNGRKYGNDIAAEITTIYAEWQKLSFATAANWLCLGSMQEVKA